MQGADGITQMADSLISIFRSISKDTRTCVRLNQELEFLKNYIKLQQFRYGDSFRYQVDRADEALGNAVILKFALQPIIENAIFHGLEARRDTGGGLISIRAEKIGKDLRISVQDNGAGMTAQQIQELFKI